MALNFDLSQIKDWEKVCIHEGATSGLTQVIIFMTMFVGINELTDKTLPEFKSRAKLYERVFGALSSDGISLDDENRAKLVDKHVGLKTNASKLSDSAFWKNIRRSWTERESRKLLF